MSKWQTFAAGAATGWAIYWLMDRQKNGAK